MNLKYSTKTGKTRVTLTKPEAKILEKAAEVLAGLTKDDHELGAAAKACGNAMVELTAQLTAAEKAADPQLKLPFNAEE